jgi:parallel beta-helix repeat protein
MGFERKRAECNMNRRVVWAVVVCACLLSAMVWPFFVTRVEASPKTIYVDAGNVNDPNMDGSAAHPFSVIQKGVDAAGSGDTIQVAAGVYYESVQIGKSSISLVGEKGSTIIDGNGTEPVGIRLYRAPPDYTENVSISGFTVRNCIKGITLSRSIYTRLRDDSMVGNTYNFGDYTLQVQDIDTSNTVDGKPVYYWVDQSGKQVPADAGFVALVGSTNMTVKDLNLTNNVQGLLLKNTTDSLIENVHVLNNWDGMYLERWSNSNTVIDSSFSNNLFMGIYVSTSSSNTIENNSMLNNAYGLLLDSSVFEATIGFSNTSNTVRDNTFMGNTVANSSLDGVYLDECQDNVFFHNNFVNNARQVESLNSTSKWDDGAEGNYWADYSGEDPNKTGFADAPYVIDENNQDNHPLMGLFSDFPVTWQEETYPVTTISNSTISEFYFSQPDKMISFRVSDPNGASGFCRVSMPDTLLGGPYKLVLDGVNSTDLLETSNGTNCFLYFTYNNSYHNVKIEGTSVVPEFPSFMLVFFLAVLTVGVAIVALKRRKTHLRAKPRI